MRASGARDKLLWGRGDGLVFLGIAIMLFVFPMARGGNRLWATSLFDAAIFALGALWALLFVFGRVEARSGAARSRPIILLWLLWLAYLLLQLMPLPIPLVETLSPRAAAHYQSIDAVRGGPGQAYMLSISPGDTLNHLLESAGLLVLFVLVLLTARDGRRRHFLALTLVFAGVFQAMYGILFLLSGAKTGMFGDVVSPLGAATGTFVNRNHLAGYLEITGAVGIGLVLADLKSRGAGNWRARFRNFIDFLLSDTARLRVLIAIMVIALVLTRSRMGTIAFFNALAMAGLMYVLLRERRLFFKALLLFATFFLIDLLILGSWFGLDELVARLENTQVSQEARINVFPALRLAMDAYWPFGSGGGTFYTAFPEFRPPEISKLYYHAHNDYLEFAIETGAFGLALLGGIILLVMVHAIRLLLNRKDRLVGGIAFAGLMATIAVGVHSTVDFNLQIPANAAAYVTILGLVMSCSPHRRQAG
jgi:putative inorganic carbon (HCO3(-)) transporter